MANCPLCHSDHVVKNGHIHNGKQRFKCCDCGRQFIENPTKIIISQQTKSLIDQPKAGAARSFIVRKNFPSWYRQSYSSVSEMVARLRKSKVCSNS